MHREKNDFWTIAIITAIGWFAFGIYELLYAKISPQGVAISRGLALVGGFVTARYFGVLKDYIHLHFGSGSKHGPFEEYIGNLLAMLISHWTVYVTCMLLLWIFGFASFVGTLKSTGLSLLLCFVTGPATGLAIQMSRDYFEKNVINIFNLLRYDRTYQRWL